MKVAKQNKGKLQLGKYLKQLKPGDRVVFRVTSSSHKGVYHRRFHGKTGDIISIKGKSCEVKVNDKNKQKTVLTNPVHLVKVKNGTKNN